MTDLPDNPSAELKQPDRQGDGKRWTRADVGSAVGVVALTTLFFLPTVCRRPLSASHEAKAGLIARHMIERRQWFVADIDVAYINKPPVYYWMVAGLSLLAGHVDECTIRLPNLLSCVAVVLLTWAFARNLWDRRAGVLSACVLATMLHFHWLAQSARLDSTLTLSVTAAVFCFWKALSCGAEPKDTRCRLWAAAGYVSMALGIGVKGPVALVLAGLVVAAIVLARRLSREGRLLDDLARLHPVAGVVILLVLTAPIYYGMERDSGGRFLRYFFLRENLARAGLYVTDVKQFRGSHSFFYYFGTILVDTVPWTIFLPAALLLPVFRYRKGAGTAPLVPLLHFAAPFLFLCAVPVKTWLYVMPVLPPLAMLCGHMWSDLLGRDHREGAALRCYLRFVAIFGILLSLVLLLTVTWMTAPSVVSKLIGPQGLIRVADFATFRPTLHRAMTADFMKGVVPLVLLAAGLGLAAVALMCNRRRTAVSMLIAVTALGMLYHNFVLEPTLSAGDSHRSFAQRLNEHLARGRGAPLVCVRAGQPYELLFYLRHPVRIIRRPQDREFLSRVRPIDSAQAGSPVNVLLGRPCFEELAEKLGPLPVVLASPDDESWHIPLVVTTVRVMEPPEAPAPGRDPRLP